MSDHFVRLQYSDDGGHNWSNWDQQSIGDTGEYLERIKYTRLGSFRSRVLRIQVSSPRRRDLLGGVAVLQPTQG